MPRPRRRRRICFNPHVSFYKPQGVPLRSLQIMELSLEEVEALRLKNVAGLQQIECAEKMHTSQSTFQRILSTAQQKVSQAVVNGWAIKINQE